MPSSPTTGAPPRSILLATDLGGRCDRALDRAVALARQWQARLVAVTVLDPSSVFLARESPVQRPGWPRRLDPVDAARRRLRSDADADDLEIVVRVEQGQPGDTLLRIAEEEGCGLLVTGTARNETFGRMVLGSTVDWLSRRAALPLLVVQDRPRGAYRDIVAATDFSESSGHALRTAVDLFPQARLHLLHALDVPLLGLRDVRRGEELEAARSRVLLDGRAFLEAAAIAPEARQRATVVVEPGEPARLVQEYARDHECDLVVLGTHGRSALADMLLGSSARAILEKARTDVLVVRGPRGDRP